MKKSTKKRSLTWQIKKYQRWARHYLLRVRMVETEMNGAIEPC